MALSGMTGFGRAEGALGAWSWAVEARSVNGRNLEVRFRGPPGFDGLERAAREGAQGRFARGQLQVSVQAKKAETATSVRINTGQLETYLAAAAPYVAAGQAQLPTMGELMTLRGVVEAADAEDDPEAMAALEAAIAASLGAALDALAAARKAEGDSLTVVLTGLMDTIAELVAQAADLAAGQPAAIKARFEKRMGELIGETSAAVEERIVQEAAAMAVKADVREELDRLAQHVAAARELIGGQGAAGRRLDFLTQEFMREANTLCAKSALGELTAVGLSLKATIEQLREQVQNVE
ncbi:YicC/YloC family endoribonuclease [Phenylobacterium sp.]|jgi:uncharacterized protein (TIGR00255 family)|uniref:YicC/YloC family endoribonuclease n=1 Tax=Phenylobacterium sp. TaxID=1871053 RepID=UPI002E316B5A|nr:YicC/YloC family endoribonuclease [Phenylobacterium sp.]HEX2561243.1 YicC/YloC family endoribonuclease [Phenylobacterium sp.]